MLSDEEKEAIEILKDNIKSLEGHTPFKHTNYKKVQAIETLLTAYEKEKEKNKKIENELKGITKKYMEAESVKFWYNYIHKDKIRKMLQELEDRRNKQPVIGYWSKKAMLEKLLKEE